MLNNDNKKSNEITKHFKRHRRIGFLIYLLFVTLIIFMLLWVYFTDNLPFNLNKYIYVRDEPISYQTIITKIYGDNDTENNILTPSSTITRKIDLIWEVMPKKQNRKGIITYVIYSITNEDGVDVSNIIYLEFEESVDEIYSNQPFVVNIMIKMHEPENQTEYNLVAGHQVKIKLSFKVDPALTTSLKNDFLFGSRFFTI
ncbi:MAG: hypothetical protein PHD47_00900 [Acholeplasmataceae bacterium]|nr:hypothetical protein [Acholeplasmataceae bacterium]